MRTTERKAQERRRALIISGVIVLLAAAAAIATLFETSSRIDQPMTAAASDKFRAATITSHDGTGCAQQVFDNRTGRVTTSTQPCIATSYDGNGMPIPTGTIHRLDAISKSFRSHQDVD